MPQIKSSIGNPGKRIVNKTLKIYLMVHYRRTTLQDTSMVQKQAEEPMKSTFH